jgi:Prokaryotic E2 family D
MAAEILPEHVLARTPELITWWSRAQPRLMFFGDGNAEAKKLNGKMFPHPALVFMIHGRELFVRTRRKLPTKGRYAPETRSPTGTPTRPAEFVWAVCKFRRK